jgi:hypothetical protein
MRLFHFVKKAKKKPSEEGFCVFCQHFNNIEIRTLHFIKSLISDLVQQELLRQQEPLQPQELPQQEPQEPLQQELQELPQELLVVLVDC